MVLAEIHGGELMKRLLAGLLVTSLMVGHVEATALQYPPSNTTPVASSSSKSNVVPITAIVASVAAIGFVVFKVRRNKQAKAARFNIYVAQGGTHVQ